MWRYQSKFIKSNRHCQVKRLRYSGIHSFRNRWAERAAYPSRPIIILHQNYSTKFGHFLQSSFRRYFLPSFPVGLGGPFGGWLLLACSSNYGFFSEPWPMRIASSSGLLSRHSWRETQSATRFSVAVTWTIVGMVAGAAVVVKVHLVPVVVVGGGFVALDIA